MGSTSTAEGPGRGEVDLGELVGDVAGFLADVARLLARVLRDPRVPARAKALLAAAGVYVVSPLDVLPDALPWLGRLDDLWLLARALRHLVRSAGVEVVEELWPGTEEGLRAVLFLAGAERGPGER